MGGIGRIKGRKWEGGIRVGREGGREGACCD